MPYADVLVHTAQPVEEAAGHTPPRVEGDYDVVETLGPPFPCCLFMSFTSESDRRGRTAVEPLILAPGDVRLERTQRLRITAPEVTGPDPVEWQILAVQPFGKPGAALVGKQATLRRIEGDG